MKEFVILGANHFALSMILETLLVKHGPSSIFIYSNTDHNEHKEKGIPYAAPGLTIFERSMSQFEVSDKPCFIAGMSSRSRKAIYEDFSKVVPDHLLEPLIYPNVILASTCEIGFGVRIENNVSINPFAKIGNLAFINRAVTVGHHTNIGNFTNINPGAHITGSCDIGAGVTIGAGAIVNDGISIGEGSIIGSGSVVTRNIPAGVVAFGCPAKIIKEVE
ncbi:MAG TPA: DapH/DapD/GlmU-related protein [Saprospiraceae bacterium]|nr:DapH/DapD/GlmU-related protein [Saprospiraceae bacterium]HPN68952.1 DapH/DapD/GlmU-related protein [Saprospiraceae bacterium]